jgi:sialate O-acetylesterase
VRRGFVVHGEAENEFRPEEQRMTAARTDTMPRSLHKIFLIALLLVATIAHSQSWKTLIDLRGVWKFELGDDETWADPKYDDSNWDEIRVPASWENEGYPGYDGYAWYRTHFRADASLKNTIIYLHLGYTDDVSEVYLNGRMVGFQGEFPPHFSTAYNIYGQYVVPQEYLNYTGDNVIAVRVYDYRLAGGISHGRVGLFAPRHYLKPDFNLAGVWKFKTGDNDSWKEPSLNDGKWNDVLVPTYWESQGFKDYDGFAWYRLKFKTPEHLPGTRLILLLGKIDDMDETYLNGELIGRTGRMRTNVRRSDINKEYQELRAYEIPTGTLIPDKENVLAVRVCDPWRHGGIYDGPIGLVGRDKYLKWKKQGRSWWEMFDWFK